MSIGTSAGEASASADCPCCEDGECCARPAAFPDLLPCRHTRSHDTTACVGGGPVPDDPGSCGDLYSPVDEPFTIAAVPPSGIYVTKEWYGTYTSSLGCSMTVRAAVGCPAGLGGGELTRPDWGADNGTISYCVPNGTSTALWYFQVIYGGTCVLREAEAATGSPALYSAIPGGGYTASGCSDDTSGPCGCPTRPDGGNGFPPFYAGGSELVVYEAYTALDTDGVIGVCGFCNMVTFVDCAEYGVPMMAVAARAATVSSPGPAAPCLWRSESPVPGGEAAAAGLNPARDWYRCTNPDPAVGRLNLLVSECSGCGVPEGRRCGPGSNCPGYEPAAPEDAE